MKTNIIEENSKGNENTFIGRLHEEGFFDIDLFWELYDEINRLSSFYIEELEFPKSLINNLFKVHGTFLAYVGYHFDSSDNFKISNISEINYSDYLERVRCLFENFGVRQLPESMFDDGLRIPQKHL